MIFTKRFLSFNKEIILGQVGSFIGAQIAASLTYVNSSSPESSSLFVVLGSLVASCLFWALTRIYDNRRKRYSSKKFLRDVERIAPAAALSGIVVGYPVMYFLFDALVTSSVQANIAALIAQIISGLAYLVVLDAYMELSHSFSRRRV